MDHRIGLVVALLMILGLPSQARSSEAITKFWAPERYYLSALSEQAGKPDKRNIDSIKGIELVSFKSGDGAILKGYRLPAIQKVGDLEKGYMLVLPGNAQLCDRVLKYFDSIRKSGIDVYLYDYRGFGNSTGESTLSGIIDDVRLLLGSLDASYKHKFIYGISFGGFILLNALQDSRVYKQIIIDSTPASLGSAVVYKFQPTQRLPQNCENFFFILGEQDQIVTPDKMKPLLQLAQKRGARVWRSASLGHPFDPNRSSSEAEERIKKILETLTQRNRP